MIALLFTDAEVDPPSARPPCSGRSSTHVQLRVSIDTDTSTSDTAVVLASGAAGPVDADAFERSPSARCAWR